MNNKKLRNLPSVSDILDSINAIQYNLPYHLILKKIRQSISEFRNEIMNGNELTVTDLIPKIKNELEKLNSSSLQSVINGTGIILHTGLGRAPISEEILNHNPNSLVLYDLRSSWIVPEMIEKFSGRSLRCRVGHSFIKQKMREDNAIFAGELSGHFYFKNNFFTDSGIITAIWVMNLLSAKGIPFSELIRPLKKYYSSGEINSEVKDKEAKMKELAENYKEGRVSWLDGVRVDFDDWWFNVRPSNTEPLLRLNLEAKTEQKMEEMRNKLLSEIRS